MRRIQPKAAAFILTGYPDFQTALEAIRKQVDDYFTKPAYIAALVSTLREKARTPRVFGQPPCKRVSDVILEHSDEIVRRWLNEVKLDKRLTAVRISDDERIDRLPLLLRDLANALEAQSAQVPSDALSAAAVHGTDRARQGYTIPLMVTEMRTSIGHRCRASSKFTHYQSEQFSSGGAAGRRILADDFGRIDLRVSGDGIYAKGER